MTLQIALQILGTYAKISMMKLMLVTNGKFEVIERKKRRKRIKVRAMAVQYHHILLRVGLGKKLWHWWVSVA